MAIIKKTKKKKCCQRCGEKATNILLVGMCISTPITQNNTEVPEKAKNRTNT
jgi:hypothetical protein